MRVSFQDDPPPPPPPPMEQAPVTVTFDLEDGSDPMANRGNVPKDIESAGDMNSGTDDFLDECMSYDDSNVSSSHRDSFLSNNKGNNSNKNNNWTGPLGSKATMLREALVCLYFLQTVGTTVLVYFLAEDSSDDDNNNDNNREGQEDWESPPFDTAGFYDIPSLVFALIVASIFSMVGGLAYVYHSILMHKLRSIDKSAQESKAIVSSLFPAQFRERLLEERATGDERVGLGTLPDTPLKNSFASPDNSQKTLPDASSKSQLSYTGGLLAAMPNKAQLKNYLQQKDSATWNLSKPIADLFPNCTVLFADIAGFTAWSSEREPAQVFLLLESLYMTFDQIAKRLKVFKVETIGDCYVAVTGLPDPQHDHAIRMVRFAKNLMQRMIMVVKNLERTLGPETADLRLRVGIHSGPVTAGIMRGERSRFQIFGDTVNTASRVESTSEKNRIQLSQSTADLLIQAGKESWVTPREDMVEAKGKGSMQCYWALLRNARGTDGSVSAASRSSGGSSGNTSGGNKSIGWGFDDEDEQVLTLPPMSRSNKNKRLVDWHVEMFSQLLKRVVAQRDPTVAATQRVEDPNAVLEKMERGDTPYEEVVESIELPRFDTATTTSHFRDSSSIELGPDVLQQLRALITQIANGYHDNPFHNFEHASHVTMSVHKLLNRVVTPDEVDYDRDSLDVGIDVHNYTYGITSDALCQFGIIFSSLIHDLDHPGVSNGQLSEEKPELGEKYKNRSVAEQNSVDIAWGLLMQPEYRDLQQCIFSTEEELRRFRSTIVNSVLATDIFEKDGKAFRNQRWEKAFHSASESSSNLCEDTTNLRATIVIEHIIQASDVSHTMQHWSIYQKWNERLFRELFLAYDQGRSATDPSKGWYKGELWFYDNYVIPLAKKLAECKVFGVSSDESLNYAMANRQEWAQKGEQVVKDMVDRYQKRKELEIGGLTNDEINGFTPQDLEYVMKKLIEKGRSNGTKRVDAAKGQNDAAQAWMDALEVYERAPAALEVKDRSIVFPVYSGIHAWLKGGKIQNDKNGFFEQNLARKFVRESKRFRRDPIHYYRAMAMLCEVTAIAGNYTTALDLLETLKADYDVTEHSLRIEKGYGVDRPAVAFGLSAMWHDQMGNDEEALAACDYVITTLLPLLDGTNTLGMFELLIPVLKILKQHGRTKQCLDLFNEYVHEAFLKNHGPDAFTPTKSLHKPIVWLFSMLHDPDNFTDFDEAAQWLGEGDNGTPNGFLDNIVIKTSWGPSDMAAELCLLVAKKLRERNGDGDMELCKTIAGKGLRLAQVAENKIKDMNGEVVLQYAYKVHQPVLAELEEFAKVVGVFTEAPARTEATPGVKVTLPSSYLVTPSDAADYVGFIH